MGDAAHMRVLQFRDDSMCDAFVHDVRVMHMREFPLHDADALDPHMINLMLTCVSCTRLYLYA